MGRGTDLLLQLALEHRELAQSSRLLRQRGRDLTRTALLQAAIRIVEHELAHRLLVHPLLRRDGRGRELFSERREEQLLLADRLRHLLAAIPGNARDGTDPLATDPVVRLDQQLAAHTDREEIVSFPHLRRTVDAEELAELGGLRLRLRDLLLDRFSTSATAIAAGTWADTPRRDLPRLLDLPDDLVTTLPDLEVDDRTPAN